MAASNFCDDKKSSLNEGTSFISLFLFLSHDSSLKFFIAFQLAKFYMFCLPFLEIDKFRASISLTLKR